MPRKIIPIISNVPYHVSARCINKEWFDLPIEIVWAIMEDYLYLMSKEFDVKIHSFVLMSNHFHLLITATKDNLSAALLYFMRETSREISRLSGRINQTYGARNHKTLLTSYHYFMNTYKYIYQNPLRAGLCKRVEDYRFSTLNGLCGLNRLIIPVEEDTILFDPNFIDANLEWLNIRPSLELENEMRLALTRPEFKLSLCKTSRNPSLLEEQLF